MIHEYKTKEEAIQKAKELGCIGTHKMYNNRYMPCRNHKSYLDVIKRKSEKSEGEIDELVDRDGTFLSSKIPILDPHVTPKKTMDQTVSMARNVYDIFRMGYRRHFYEEDMSKVFGREEETDFMTYDETVDYLSELLGIEDTKSKSEKKEIESNAEERAKEMGKIPGKKKMQRLFEKENEVTEDILVKKSKKDGDITKKETSVSKILKKNIKFLKKQAETEGITINELIKMLKSE
jgi:hypothetical protein